MFSLRLGSLLTIVVLLSSTMAAFGADDFSCPPPSTPTGEDVSATINGKAQTLLKVANADIEGTVKTTIVNLYSEYPHADRVAIINTMINTTCNFIKTSKQLSDGEKIDKWMAVYPAILLLMPPGNEKKSELPAGSIGWKTDTICRDNEHCLVSMTLHRPADWDAGAGAWSSPEDENVIFSANITGYVEGLDPDSFIEGAFSKEYVPRSVGQNTIRLSYVDRIEFVQINIKQSVQVGSADEIIVIGEELNDGKNDYIISCQILKRLLDKYRDSCYHFLREVTVVSSERAPVPLVQPPDFKRPL